MAADWLAGHRGELAAGRILDAAGDLFTRRDAAAVGMGDIASAAGCSRATLYRYFENRDVLYTAYVHREAQRLHAELAAQLADIADPGARLVEGVIAALRAVRGNPALASWFAVTGRPIGGEMAEHSEVIAALVEGFIKSLGDAGDVERRARWLVRVITSLLVFPGSDEHEERALLDEFVAPVLLAGADRT
jgi:AcrR family transcriptional regulator